MISLFQIGCVFAKYDPIKPTIFIQIFTHRFSYKFDTVLHQFLETETSDRTRMRSRSTPEMLRFQPIPPGGLDQLLKCLGFSLYPLLFFLYSPFKNYKI